jgi:hypothetical protein
VIVVEFVSALGERSTYMPISPDPGMLGRFSVGSSGGSRKPAQEESNSDDINRRIAADCLMWRYSVPNNLLDLPSIAPVKRLRFPAQSSSPISRLATAALAIRRPLSAVAMPLCRIAPTSEAFLTRNVEKAGLIHVSSVNQGFMKSALLITIMFAAVNVLFQQITKAASDTTAFDGTWSVTMSAQNYDNPNSTMSLAFAKHFTMTVKNGALHGESGRVVRKSFMKSMGR